MIDEQKKAKAILAISLHIFARAPDLGSSPSFFPLDRNEERESAKDLQKLNFKNKEFSSLAALVSLGQSSRWLQTYFAFNGTNSRQTRWPRTEASARRPTSPM